MKYLSLAKLSYLVELLNKKFNTKVDKVEGKGLSTNDFSDNDKDKLNAAYNHVLSFMDTMLDIVYPIGSIYISTNGINPAELFGGTWERIKEKFLLGASEQYLAGSSGGEVSHALTIDEMPVHSHSIYKVVHNNTDISNSKPYYGNLTSDDGSKIFYQTDGSYKTMNSGGGGTQQYATLSCSLHLGKNVIA